MKTSANKPQSEINKNNLPENGEFAFKSSGLLTDTSKTKINLSEVLGGGPAKDGIPSIDNPKFYSVSEALKVESPDVNGLTVESNGEAKFYPYSILVWHEIVNDEINGEDILVTFCPLCGTGIVFDPKVDGVARDFGVSGKLWQSNLLMYDRVNESLWSQSIGEAVVGTDLGKKLELIDSNLITLQTFASKYPNGKVLTRETGHSRNYGISPYSGYEDTSETFFPVRYENSELFSKEIMYVFVVDEQYVALKRSDLIAEKNLTLNVNDQTINITATNEDISIKDSDGKELPGFHEMWFSFVTQHPENGSYWTKESGFMK